MQEHEFVTDEIKASSPKGSVVLRHEYTQSWQYFVGGKIQISTFQNYNKRYGIYRLEIHRSIFSSESIKLKIRYIRFSIFLLFT